MKKKSVTNGLALFAEYGFVSIHYKQKQHLKGTKQTEKKVQVIHHFFIFQGANGS